MLLYHGGGYSQIRCNADFFPVTSYGESRRITGIMGYGKGADGQIVNGKRLTA